MLRALLHLKFHHHQPLQVAPKLLHSPQLRVVLSWRIVPSPSLCTLFYSHPAWLMAFLFRESLKCIIIHKRVFFGLKHQLTSFSGALTRCCCRRRSLWRCSWRSERDERARKWVNGGISWGFVSVFSPSLLFLCFHNLGNGATSKCQTWLLLLPRRFPADGQQTPLARWRASFQHNF